MKDKNTEHSLEVDEILKLYDASIDGISTDDANRRLKLYGENVLKEKDESKFKIFFRQFNSILVFVLIFAAIISLLAGKHIDFL